MTLSFRPKTPTRRFLAYYAAYLLLAGDLSMLLRPLIGALPAALVGLGAFMLAATILNRAERNAQRQAHAEFLARRERRRTQQRSKQGPARSHPA